MIKVTIVYICIFLAFAACEKKEVKTSKDEALLKLLSEPDNTVKIVKQDVYVSNIKDDLPKIIKAIDDCVLISKKYEKRALKDSDLKKVKGVQSFMDDMNEKYVLETREENPINCRRGQTFGTLCVSTFS